MSPAREAECVGRRAALRVGGLTAAALLVGCTDGDRPGPSPSASLAAHPDIAVLASLADEERALLAAYDSPSSVATPVGRSALRLLRAHHLAHLDDLVAAMATLGVTATERASPSPSAPATSTSPTPPRRPARTPAQLRVEEQRTGRGALTAVAAAADGDVALLIAEISASHAQHVVVLGGVR